MISDPRTILLSCGFGLALLLSSNAATVTVTNTNDSGAGSLRNALSAANPGDTINFNLSGCPCTIVVTGATLLINKSLNIQGPGAAQLTISGNDARKVFSVSGAGFITISGLTIANGRSSAGGGGLLGTGVMTVANCVFTNNVTTGSASGGAIFFSGGTLTLLNLVVTGNSSASVGGGIATPESGPTVETVTVVDSVISQNTAPNFGSGGGIFAGANCLLTVVNSNFTGNSAGAGAAISCSGKAAIRGGAISSNDATGLGGGSLQLGGGGVAVSPTGIVSVEDASISNNDATGGIQGGGIWNLGNLTLSRCTVSGNNGSGAGGIYSSGSLTMTDSAVSGNIAVSTSPGPAGGGGLRLAHTGSNSVSIIRSTISGNSAHIVGGGIDSSGTLLLESSTISGNQVTSGSGSGGTAGGGIYAMSGAMTLTNCTIAFNSSSGIAGGVRSDSGGKIGNTIIAKNTGTPANEREVSGSFMSQGFNLIGAVPSGSGFTNGVNGDIVGAGPAGLDPLLDPLANNGGPTLTHALQSGSPAIDKGNTPFGVTADQRGFPRYHDMPSATNAIGGNFSDIGAFELGDSTLRITSITRLPMNGHIRLQAIGLPNAVHSIQAAMLPSAPAFVTIAPVLSDPLGNLQFEDEDAAALLARFYRLAFP